MSVIIRLQNLPWSANALDIRQYFNGLSIPEGGVHIVGGELGDAFIAFSTDEDARQAMLIDGGKIKEVKIKLYLSSRSEMQKVIETARAQSISLQSFMHVPTPQIPSTPLTATQIPPTPPQTAPAMPPMPPISQVPVKTTTPDIKPPPLPPIPSVPAATAPEIIKTESETEKKDQDTESVSSKDAKRSRRRSRSKSKNRSKSSDRSKSRERSKSRDRSRSRERSYRSKDRYRDRRRRDRSRSRDRRDRRRYRDRSRSRDRSSRKSSRDRKRDSDRNDRSSIENSSGSKNIIPEKDREIPLPSTPSIPVSTAKPGFITSGWVSADTTDKAAGSILPNTIGFTIGKSPTNVPTPQPPPQPPAPRLNMVSPQQIPLPQQIQIPHQMQTPQQVPTTQPTIPVTHPIQMPQPPIFPPIPKLEAPKDQDGTLFPPMSFPTIVRQPPNIPTTQQNALIGRSQQQQMTQNEPTNMLPNDSGLLSTPTGWPLMDHKHMISSQQIANSGGNQAPTYQANTLDKSAMPMPMNVGMGMYIAPSSMPTNENFQLPYMQQDPRMQNTFNTLQPRSDFRSSERNYPQMNNFNSQKQSNYGGRDYDPTNQRDMFSNTCVEIRNMSMNTTNIDIHRFFQGLQIPGDGVKIITDKKGNKVGMAYVRFAKVFFKDMALKKTGQTLKNSIVEVLHIDDSIFDKATDFSEYSGNYMDNSKSYQDNYSDNFNNQHIPTEPFMDIVIHDIPPYTKDREIYNLFKGYKISDAFVLLRTGRKTATAYVKFKTAADARKALISSSRLTIGYTNVKATVCYEHEFADARDRKNMEENDEEMIDSKDVGYVPNETRTSRGLEKYPLYDYNKDRPDPRYNKPDNRASVTKVLLPTPSYNIFDPRSPAHNNSSSSTSNYPSRFDRRQQDIQPPRMPRADFHKKPYGREDLYQTPFPRENSRFQQKSISRDGQHKMQASSGEFYKNNKPLDEFYPNLEEKSELCKKTQSPQYPSSTAKSAFSSDGSPTPDKVIFNPKLLVSNLEDKINKNEKQTEAKSDAAVNNTIESIKDKTPLISLNQNTEINKPADTVLPNTHPVKQTEEVIAHNENKQPLNLENQSGPEAKSDQVKEDMDFIDTDCIILRGLPFSATDRDILDFFSDEGLAPTQIHVMLDKQEQPAGDAFCEFNTVEEVTRALTKNKTLMGRSLVSVEPVTREEMMEALGSIVAHPDHPNPDFPSDYPRKDNRLPRLLSLSGYPPHFPSRGRGRGAFRNRHPPPVERELETQNVSSFGKPGCVVALENVPFRAEVQDILDFFRGFYVHRDNIIRRFDEHGKATGDARVCLSSPLEAQRAVRTLNYRQIHNRQIHLTMVPY